MASLRAVTLLCRSESALHAAASELGALCGAPFALASLEDVLIARSRRLAPLTLMHTPAISWRWRSPGDLQIVCAHIGAGAPARAMPEAQLFAALHAGASAALVPGDGDAGESPAPPRTGVAVAYAALVARSLLSAAAGRWQERALAEAHVALVAGESGETSALEAAPRGESAPAPAAAGSRRSSAVAGAADPSLALILKEVVIGSASASAFRASEAALERGGAARSLRSPSLWHLAGDGGGVGPAVRLLPSRFSALIFRSPLPLPRMRDALLARLAAAPALAAGAGRELGLYGQRRGDESSGQLVFSSPALAGLDLRFCSAEAHAPFFNECAGSMSEDVDASLNPEAGAKDPAKQIPLACRSIVGLDLRATLRKRIGELY